MRISSAYQALFGTSVKGFAPASVYPNARFTIVPGIGVFEQIRSFFPQATPILYSVQTKAQLVLRAKELIEEHRLQWDASQNDIAHAFLTIRQGTTDSGQITYSASRTSSTGHADVAWAIMHALEAKPLGRQRGGCVIAV